MHTLSINIDFEYAETDDLSFIYYQKYYFVLVKHKKEDCTPQSAMEVLMTRGGVPAFAYTKTPVKSSRVVASKQLHVGVVNNAIDKFNDRFFLSLKEEKKVKHIKSIPNMEWTKHTYILYPFRDIVFV